MENDQNLFLYSSEKLSDSSLPILNFLQKNDIKNFQLSKDVSKVQNTLKQYKELQIDVIGTKIVDNKFTLYEIKLQRGNVYWVFQTRYSLLKALDDRLSKNFKLKVQKFPESKVFGNLEQEFISRRAKQLNIYLKSLIKYCNQEKTIQNFLKESQEAAIVIYDPDEIDYFRLDA
ncbi:unnamed protein product [Paramecium primaurelia]|uniref:PX domain-containing protein n=1 Tax=Paramecium primaurelia TaxID=5886 RepID=A0A8S1KIW0_PARPR|nr:unnamed protein product [Paramecium primaurelia]